MIPDFDQLQALRDCCRDEAAFERLQQILAASDLTARHEQENSSDEATIGPLQKQCRPISPFAEATHSCPGLLQGVAEASHQLLTNPDATAINQSLATLGSVTGVDRVYIFEVHPHPETGEPAASQRFEWARESVTPQINNPDLQNQILATDGLMQWYDALSAGQSISGLSQEFGIAERQLLESQQIRSILMVPILINGKLWGLIGFDDCHLERRWSKDESAVLLMMATNLGGLIARQQTEAALRQSESRFQKMAANLPGMIFQFLRRPDSSESLLFASSGCRELFEVEPAETQVNFSQLKALIHPDDRQAYEQSVAASATTLQPWAWEGRIVTPSGQLKWVQCASRPEQQPNGDILWDGLLMDITDRKQAEQALRSAEAATRASELRFRSIVTSTPGVIYRCACDPDWTMEFVSNEIATISGYPATDFIANQVRTFASIIHPEDTAMVEQVVQQGIEARQPYVIEYRIVRADGATRWVYEKGQGVYDEDGLLWLDGAIFDISDRKQAEAALRESEEKFSKAFHSSPSAITITKFLEGRLIEVNDSFLRIGGYQREEAIGRTTTELNIWVNLEDRARIIQMVQEAGMIRNQESLFRKKSGEVFVGLFSAEIINLASEPCLLSVVQDITDLKRAEKQLRLSAERDRLLAQIALRIRQSLDLEQILNTTVTEVCHFLQADRVFIGYLDANNLHGKIMAESVAPNWQSVLGVVFPQTYLEEVRAIFTQGSVQVVDDTTQGEISPVWAKYFHQYQVRASLAVPILLEDPFLSVLVVHQCSGPRHWQPFEIDLLKQLATQVAIAIQQAELYQQVLSFNANLEQQVEERTAQLEQRNRELQELNRLKDIFLHAVSHDLRTPVMGTLLVLKNLLNQPVETLSFSRSILERMIQSNERQLSLINSLLEVHTSEAQGITLHRERLQLGTLVQAVITDMEPLLAKNQATLTNLIPATLPLVSADPTQLRRVLENLLTNALKHNPPGLSLVLSATVDFGLRDTDQEQEAVESDEKQLNNPKSKSLVSVSPTDRLRPRVSVRDSAQREASPQEKRQRSTQNPKLGMIRCTLEDNGVGMSPAECDRLFELYFRGASARHLTGIGLGLYLCRQIITAHGGEIGVISSPGAGATFWFTLPIEGSSPLAYAANNPL